MLHSTTPVSLYRVGEDGGERLIWQIVSRTNSLEQTSANATVEMWTDIHRAHKTAPDHSLITVVVLLNRRLESFPVQVQDSSISPAAGAADETSLALIRSVHFCETLPPSDGWLKDQASPAIDLPSRPTSPVGLLGTAGHSCLQAGAPNVVRCEVRTQGPGRCGSGYGHDFSRRTPPHSVIYLFYLTDSRVQ